MDVDAVHQRATDAIEVMLHLSRRAHATLNRMIVIATGTGIHRCDQHETGRIVDVILYTRDAYLSIFQRLAKHLQDIPLKFCQLVKKEYTVVGQRDFSGLRITSSTGHCHIGNRVVRRAERSPGDESSVGVYLTRNRMYLCGLEALAQREGWQDGRQSLGKHRFPASG